MRDMGSRVFMHRPHLSPVQGNYAEAERLYRQALEVSRRCGQQQGAQFAVNLAALAGVYQQLGNVREAEHHYREALHVIDESRIELSEVPIFVAHPFTPRWRRGGTGAQPAGQSLPLVHRREAGYLGGEPVRLGREGPKPFVDVLGEVVAAMAVHGFGV